MRARAQTSLVISCIALLAACAPSVTVQNDTPFPVRVIVTSGGKREILSPSPGNASTSDASEGAFTATAIPDAEWIEYAKLTRKVLNEQLANADNLTGPQLLEVIRRLKDIAQKMQAFERAAGKGASCGGRITDQEGAGLVTVTTGPDGGLVVKCK